MKTKKVNVMLYILCIALPLTSCVKDIDLDQANDIVLTPVYEVDFVYSRFDTSQFIDPNENPAVVIPEIAINDTLDYDLLGTDFVIDNLEQIVFTFEFSNTIERDFDFSFGFLDDANRRIGPSFTITANAGLGAGTDPVVTTEEIILDNATINVLGTATQLISSIRIQNINSSLQGLLELRSKGTYFINYEL